MTPYVGAGREPGTDENHVIAVSVESTPGLVGYRYLREYAFTVPQGERFGDGIRLETRHNIVVFGLRACPVTENFNRKK